MTWDRHSAGNLDAVRKATPGNGNAHFKITCRRPARGASRSWHEVLTFRALHPVAEVMEGRVLLSTVYSVTDLGNFGAQNGGTSSTAINGAGTVVGESYAQNDDADYANAFAYTAAGGIADLGTLPGDDSSSAQAINSQGDIVGFAQAGTGSGSTTAEAFAYYPGRGMQGLGTLKGQDQDDSIAEGINDSGTIVGFDSPDGNIADGEAWVYTPQSGMRELPTLGGQYAVALAINNAGDIVGQADTQAGVAHAFEYVPGKGIKDLGTLGGPTSVAFAINNAGQIVGQADTVSGQSHAFLYTPGTGMTDLGTLGGATSGATSINNNGQIVGIAQTLAGISDNFIYDPATGMVDLLPLLRNVTDDTNTTFLDNNGDAANIYINDSGTITTENDLLTPISAATGTVASSIQLTTSQSPSGQGQALTLTATVTGSDNGTPTGSVSFYNGATFLGAAVIDPVAGGANLSANLLPTKVYAITGVYSGDATYAPSTSAPLTQIVSPNSASVATSTQLASSNSAPGATTPVTLTATVLGGDGGTPSGIVDFYNGGTQLGQALLQSDGTAALTITLPAGVDTVTADYVGNATYEGSSAPSITEAVTASSEGTTAATLTLTTSQITPATGQSVAFNAVATGSDGGTSLGSVSLSGGTASFSTTALPVGIGDVTALYSGDPVYQSTTSNSVIEFVDDPATQSANSSSTALTVSDSTPATGESITYTATVTGTGAGTPTGTVIFVSGSTVVDSEVLGSTGTASYVTGPLPAGSQTIIAIYAGDSNDRTSDSADLTVTASSVTPTPTPTPTPTSFTATPGKAVIPQAIIAAAPLSFQLPVSVKNSGSTARGPVTVNLYADTGTSISSDSVLLGNASRNGLFKAGVVVPLLIRVRSRALPAGTFNLLLELVGPSGNSQLTVLPQTIDAAPAFVQLSASAGPVVPQSIGANKFGAVSITLANTGNSPATGTLTLTLGVSEDGQTVDPSITLLTKVEHAARIKAGKSVVYRLRFGRSALPSGTYFPAVSATIDGMTASAIGSVQFNAE
jgi:probable HAF family extracellular repeat protein